MMKDEKIAGVLRAEYDVVHVDAGKPKGKNLDIAAGYKAELEKNGFPYLTVLDGDGKAVANQETAALEVKDEKGESVGVKAGHDPAKVLKFLEMNKAPSVNAETVLQKGIEEARARGKNVFLHFGAPWCVWCRRMEAWMARPQIASVLEKDFVDVKIDTQRDTGGQAMLEHYSGVKDSGIPWFAFITTDGTVIADSKSPKGNIGFPGDADEIEYFKVMLRKATKKMTPAEIDDLLETLKNRPAETPAATSGGGH
jgi:thiol-disulfide isomerase/thioredoxin